jgi:hypothetical protein
MTDGSAADDVRAIEALVERQFASLSWPDGGTGDWDGFAADFLADAALYPAARPARRQSVAEFVERMRGLAGSELRSFDETVLGVDVQVFGNVAVAVAAGELVENDTVRTRAVEMLLLVKTGDAWRIVAQAWDTETPGRPLPARLSGG